MADLRAYEIERDRFALMYSGPHVHVGEMRKLYEASDVDEEERAYWLGMRRGLEIARRRAAEGREIPTFAQLREEEEASDGQ